jgi:hypothetical protein
MELLIAYLMTWFGFIYFNEIFGYSVYSGLLFGSVFGIYAANLKRRGLK